MITTSRRGFLGALAAGAASCATQSAISARGSQPNILWITCEDMSAHLGCYGAPQARTPNIDQLATEGTRYTRTFTVAAVCAPSRSCLITGMYPTTLGTCHMRCNNPPPESIRCFPAYLREAGYYCTNNVKTDYQFPVPEDAWNDNSKTAHWRNRPNPAQPFFAVFNSTVTHESQIGNLTSLPADLANRIPGGLHDPANAKLPPYYPDTEVVRKHWAHYQNLIAAMDVWVGDILKQLEEDGLAENTVVFFFSDHGAGLPRAKRWMYDSGLHVPLIVRWPGMLDAGSVSDSLISFVDFAPTVLNIAGIKAPDHMQGNAFLGNRTSSDREYIFAARDRMDERYDIIRAVRDKRYKYIRNYEPEKGFPGYISYCESWPVMKEMRARFESGDLNETQRLFFREKKPLEELYDTESDPFELHNLVDSPAHAPHLSRLREALDNWMENAEDLGFIPETELQHWLPAAQKPNLAASRAPYRHPDASTKSIFGKKLQLWLEQLNAPNEIARAKAMRTIGLFENPPTDVLLQGLDDTNPSVAYWAAVGLSNPNVANEYTLSALLNAMNNTSSTVKLGAARALLAMGKLDHIESFALAAMNEDSFFVRLAAAQLLEQWNPKNDAIIAAFTFALEDKRDPRDYVADVARRALGRPAQR